MAVEVISIASEVTVLVVTLVAEAASVASEEAEAASEAEGRNKKIIEESIGIWIFFRIFADDSVKT